MRIHIPVFLVLAALTACKDPNRQPPELGTTDSKLLEEIRMTQDSAQVVIDLLDARYDSVAPINELDAMKTRNVREMALENLMILRSMTDSINESEIGSPDRSRQEANLRTQNEYLSALLATGRAILANNSQSFGKWTAPPKETGDSSTSQVAKPGGTRK